MVFVLASIGCVFFHNDLFLSVFGSPFRFFSLCFVFCRIERQEVGKITGFAEIRGVHVLAKRTPPTALNITTSGLYT